MDAQNGVFADNKKFGSPEDGVYLAMTCLDELNDLIQEFTTEYRAFKADGYDPDEEVDEGYSFYDHRGFTYSNSHHREIFKMIFPTTTVAPTPTP